MASGICKTSLRARFDRRGRGRKSYQSGRKSQHNKGEKSAEWEKKFISLNEIIISLNEIIISLNETAISFNETNFFCGLAELLPRYRGTFLPIEKDYSPVVQFVFSHIALLLRSWRSKRVRKGAEEATRIGGGQRTKKSRTLGLSNVRLSALISGGCLLSLHP